MSIRLRLSLIILLVAVIPTLTAVLLTTAYMQGLATSSGQTALKQLGEVAIRDRALATAQQIKSYLRTHPEIDLADMTALESNQELIALSVQPVGKTGYTAVFDAQGITHFHVNPAMVGMDMSTLADSLPDFWGIFAASLDGNPAEGYYPWKDADGIIRDKFMAIIPVEGTPLRVAATTYMDEFSQPSQVMTEELERLTALARSRLSLSVALAAAVALVIGVLVSLQITGPLRQMADAAARVIQGDWEAIRPLRSRDELGTLSQALSAMTRRLQELIQGLEQEVQARTADLRRRAYFLETSAEVGSAAASLLNIDELLSHVVDLINQQFGFYYTGIFLLDPGSQWAELEAASGRGGQQRPERGYRVHAGHGSAVGHVIDWGEAHITLEEEPDAALFDALELSVSEARSEIALPLRARGEVIGVLDVYSSEPEAFDADDLTILQTLADEVAMAISNARLFQRLQQALEAERRASAVSGSRVWQASLRARRFRGLRRDSHGVSPLRDLELPSVKVTTGTGNTVTVPVKVRGRVIGTVGARKPDDAGGWTPDEIEMLETLIDRLAVALESARSFEDTQRRAAREHLTREITDNIRSALTVEDALKRAMQEMARALDASEAVARVGTERLLLSEEGDGHA